MLNSVFARNRHTSISIGRDHEHSTHSEDLRWKQRGKIHALQPLGEIWHRSDHSNNAGTTGMNDNIHVMQQWNGEAASICATEVLAPYICSTDITGCDEFTLAQEIGSDFFLESA